MDKNERREKALKKAKQKKIIIISVCAVVVLAIIGLLTFNAYQYGKNRVYTDGYQTATLRDDGSFTVVLSHETKTGTYTENTEGDVITVTFVSEGRSVNGRIEKDALTLPAAWDDGHGHGTTLTLR